MTEKSSSSTAEIVVWVIGAVLLLGFMWFVIVWGGKQSSYAEDVSPESIKELLASKGLNVCNKKPLEFNQVPGFVNGQQLTVSTNCTDDTDPMKLSLLQFQDEASRNAALQRAASTHHGGFGSGVAYSYGPYVLTVQGTRTIADQVLLDEAMSSVNATQ